MELDKHFGDKIPGFANNLESRDTFGNSDHRGRIDRSDPIFSNSLSIIVRFDARFDPSRW